MISSNIHADRPQNLPEELEDQVPFLFGHFVVAVLLQSDGGVRASEPRLGIQAAQCRRGRRERDRGIRGDAAPSY